MSGMLFVCTANLCRSPMAEVFTRSLLDRRFGSGPELVPITSAGTVAQSGQPLWPLAQQELGRRGIDAGGFRSRRLTVADVESADLVLTATKAVRDEVRTHVPAAWDRIFTLRELSLLLVGVRASWIREVTPAQRLAVVPLIAADRRAETCEPVAEELDVFDPVGHLSEHVRDVADDIELAVRPLVELL